MTKILLITDDPIGEFLGGTAIRYLHFARELANDHEVTLADPHGKPASSEKFKSVGHHNSDALIAPQVMSTDLVITHKASSFITGLCRRLGKPIVFDLTCPFFLENWESNRLKPAEKRNRQAQKDLAQISEWLASGSAFLVANAAQETFWRKHIPSDVPILVVGYGISSDEADPDGSSLRPSPTGLSKPARESGRPSLLWFGGLWDWMDPFTPIAAMRHLKDQNSSATLTFYGSQRGNWSSPSRTAVRARELAHNLGLLDKNVFFEQGWVPYSERGAILSRADIGVITYPRSAETQLAHRIRLFEYIWAGKPVIMTEGDPLSAWVTRNGLGQTVPALHSEALAETVNLMAPVAAAGNPAITTQLTWANVLAPLRSAVSEWAKTLKSRSGQRPPLTIEEFEAPVKAAAEKEPFFSVVIPTLNRKEIMAACLRALFKQSEYRDQTEIVVVDDGSTDGTGQMIENIRAESPMPIRLITHPMPGRRGPAGANNTGLLYARGRYILFINSDIIPHPDLLKEHARVVLEHPYAISQGRAINSVSLDDPATRPEGYTGYTEISFGYFTTWNCVIERRILFEAGLFDEVTFNRMSWEDVEFGYRLRKMGIKQIFNKKAIGYHYHPPFELTEDEWKSIREKSILMGENAVRYHIKHPSLETRISAQIFWPSYMWDSITTGLMKLFGPDRVKPYLLKLEKQKRHKLLAFLVGLAGSHWYMKGVRTSWAHYKRTGKPL